MQKERDRLWVVDVDFDRKSMCDHTERLAKSNRYYDRFAAMAAGRTEKRDYRRAFEAFSRLLPKGGTALDVGCGAGGHLKALGALGFKAVGVEPSAASRAMAEREGFPVFDGSFETLASLPLPPVDCAWCAASLLHVPESELEAVLRSLADLLPPGGPLFLTVRLGQGVEWDRWDQEQGDAERLIQLFDEPTLERGVRASGFEIAESWIEESYWGQTSRWISILARKQGR